MIDVPATLEAVLDPEWLTAALDDVDQDDRIVAVEEVDSSQTLAQKVRFRVTIERRRRCAPHRRVLREGAPRRIARRRLLSEAHFYGELAPRLDVRMPRAYYTALDDARPQR